MREEDQKLIHIFDASLEKLVELSLAGVERTRNSLYVEVLIAYLTRDMIKLRLIVAKIEKESEIDDHAMICMMANLRLQIAEGKIDLTFVEKVLNEVEGHPLWKGDAYVVCAFAYTESWEHTRAKVLLKKGSNILEEQGAKRRSLLALKNYIACESYIYPDKNLIPEYNFLIKKALEAGEETIAGTAGSNLARHYQKSGALITALKEIDKALDLLQKDSGNKQFYLALAQKAQIHIQLRQLNEARVIVDRLRVSKDEKVSEVMKLLIEKIDETGNEDIEKDSLPNSWVERLSDQNIQLGELEEKMLAYIVEAPRTKREVIEHLYGDKIDYYSLENRFKNLIGRFRKKVPDLVVFEDGKYKVSDAVFLKGIKNVS